jgi:hypothetical protein
MARDSLPRVWVEPGNHNPIWCIRLDSNGVARFVNGYSRFNPSRWLYIDSTGILLLIVPKIDSVSARNAANDAADGTIQSYDAATHTIAYRVTRRTERLSFGGYYLFRLDSLDPEELTSAPQRCRPNVPLRVAPN